MIIFQLYEGSNNKVIVIESRKNESKIFPYLDNSVPIKLISLEIVLLS